MQLPSGSPFIKNPTKRRDLHVQVAVFDRRSRPDGGYDLGPRNELPWPLDQHAENVERGRTHRQRSENSAFIPQGQDATAWVEAEPLE